MMANVVNPVVINWYKANKNRRKSNNTLPPFSREYDTMIQCYSSLFGMAILNSGQTHL